MRAVLREGGRNRATASTAMNSSSSRSHAITSVRLAITSAEGKASSSTIYLVDLAGGHRCCRGGSCVVMRCLAPRLSTGGCR